MYIYIHIKICTQRHLEDARQHCLVVFYDFSEALPLSLSQSQSPALSLCLSLSSSLCLETLAASVRDVVVELREDLADAVALREAAHRRGIVRQTVWRLCISVNIPV